MNRLTEQDKKDRKMVRIYLRPPLHSKLRQKCFEIPTKTKTINEVVEEALEKHLE